MINHKNIDTYVPQQKNSKKLLKGFVTGGFGGILAIILLTTYTKPERIDMAKQQILDGQKVNYLEIDNQQKKIRQAKYAMAYYCEDNPSDTKCSIINQNDDRRMNPLGGLKEVVYHQEVPVYFKNVSRETLKVKKMPNNPFSWTAKKAPPILKKPKQDGIGAVVAENNLKNMIKARY